MKFRALYDGAIVMEFDFERGVGAAAYVWTALL